MPKIYLYCLAFSDDVIGFALAEDGELLAQHLSSNRSFSQHDMGLNSTWKHERYQEHYPKGYELEWVDDYERHPGLREALRLNKEQNAREAADF